MNKLVMKLTGIRSAKPSVAILRATCYAMPMAYGKGTVQAHLYRIETLPIALSTGPTDWGQCSGEILRGNR